ncbi:MAG: DEAD/DEAH box helicase family protein [Gemmatimonadaceae bacterium]|nr:DEAD/DEAH box helicase family protein [Gemmatimonadaceae bacterium]
MTDQDQRRSFARAEVRRVWERQGRICVLCQRSIPIDLMHGDHLVAWSKGGPTTLSNCQALCGSCNLRKGSEPQAVVQQQFNPDKLAPGESVLRLWQAEALKEILPRLATEPILVEACPGAGKTHFGLEVAYRLLQDHSCSRVLVFVPSLGIADGWLASASKADRASPTIPLLGPRAWGPVQPIGERWAGVVATYQSLFSAPDMFLAHATDPGHNTLVIFDEIHHVGVDSGWGRSAQEAFRRSARSILALTGTPFRTNQDAIAFVPVEGGAARPHYRYGYDRALVDQACRPIQFVYGAGTTTFRTEDGATHTVSFDDSLTEVGDRRRLRTALEYVGQGSIADLLLSDANDYLLDLRRRGDLDAAGLVVCVDCSHADRVAEFMHEEILGWRPVVACSKLFDPADPQPANAIRKFGGSHDPWIVAVNMVSEGIDIRRLRVVVHLTNRLTLLSFRQIVGRVVRIDPANVDDHGRVYLPADHTLVSMARTITDEVAFLPPPMVIGTDRRPSSVKIREDEGAERGTFQSLESVGERGAVSDTEGRFAEPSLVRLARLYIDRNGLTGTDAESLALAASENPELRAALERSDG